MWELVAKRHRHRHWLDIDSQKLADLRKSFDRGDYDMAQRNKDGMVYQLKRKRTKKEKYDYLASRKSKGKFFGEYFYKKYVDLEEMMI